MGLLPTLLADDPHLTIHRVYYDFVWNVLIIFAVLATSSYYVIPGLSNIHVIDEQSCPVTWFTSVGKIGMTASMRLTVTFTQTSWILAMQGKYMYCTRQSVWDWQLVTFTQTSLILAMQGKYIYCTRQSVWNWQFLIDFSNAW